VGLRDPVLLRAANRDVMVDNVTQLAALFAQSSASAILECP